MDTKAELYNAIEEDPAIHHCSLRLRRYSLNWGLYHIYRLMGNPGARYHHVCRYLARSTAVLSLGGDNYTLDYGRPDEYLAIDNAFMEAGKPFVIWGASIGPFDDDPDYKPIIFNHLKRADLIFVRESASQNYLAEHDVTDNVRLAADPSFLLVPREPASGKIPFEIPQDAIGINISPLISQYRGMARPVWAEMAFQFIDLLVQKTERPVLLVPHVTHPAGNPDKDDYLFLREVADRFHSSTRRIHCLPANLTAAETKWAIGQTAVFLGARTHSTIAAMSSRVPTITLSYSMKSRGINRDVFGHHEFCMPIASFTPEAATQMVCRVLQEEKELRAHLCEVIPKIESRADQAGQMLKDLVC